MAEILKDRKAEKRKDEKTERQNDRKAQSVARGLWRAVAGLWSVVWSLWSLWSLWPVVYVVTYLIRLPFSGNCLSSSVGRACASANNCRATPVNQKVPGSSFGKGRFPRTVFSLSFFPDNSLRFYVSVDSGKMMKHRPWEARIGSTRNRTVARVTASAQSKHNEPVVFAALRLAM